MKAVTPAQMNEIDNMAITRMGIPGIVLMENAALRVVEEIEKDFPDLKGKTAVVFAGKGNNGGDAFAISRHLFNRGVNLKIYILAKKESITKDAEINLKIVENMGIDIHEIVHEPVMDSIADELKHADFIIDGIFGTGLKGEVKGTAKDVIDIINASGKAVISIDIPSGVCGVTGKVLGVSIKAQKTVTFALPKLGLISHPGSEFAGKLVIADIGIPFKVIEDMNIKIQMTEAGNISSLLPVRISDSNKGDYGRVLVISGSLGMTGAGILSAGAALRTGAGLVYLGVPSSLVPVYGAALAEAVAIPLEDEGKGMLSIKCMEQIMDKLGRMSVIALGPGLSTGKDIFDIVGRVVSEAEVPMVLDADALNAISKDVSLLNKLKAEAVLTPHPGEMSRLTGIDIKDIQSNRIEIAGEFAMRWKVTLVLKGSKTVVALPDGNIFINTTGNSGMATAGAGDVLTGVISSLIAQGLPARDAAVAGVYLHGLAGDNVVAVKGEHGLIAGDLVEELPKTIRQLKIKNI